MFFILQNSKNIFIQVLTNILPCVNVVIEVNEMSKLISKCPNCQHNMNISVLRCPECGLEMKNDFSFSPFDQLNSDDYDFLLAFLRNRGNLKNLQNEMGISYLNARKKLDDLLFSLGIQETTVSNISKEEYAMSDKILQTSTRASERIKAKLMQSGGRTTVQLYGGELRKVVAAPDGEHFICEQIPALPYKIFDAVVDLLLHSPGCRAQKGNARNYRLGEPGCEETTVAGTVLKFFGKQPGESGLDPVFMLAAIMEWADIASNERGEIALTASFRSML